MMRLFLPTLSIIAVAALLALVIPAIDASISANEYEEGAVQQVRDVVEFSPAPGWMPDGVPAPSSPALRIFREGVSMTIAPGSWAGTADELLDSILEDRDEFHTDGERRPFELPSGMQGVAMSLFGVGDDGAVFALVAPDAAGPAGDGRGLGVRLVVRGPADLMPDYAEDIGLMLRSFAPVASGAEQ